MVQSPTYPHPVQTPVACRTHVPCIQVSAPKHANAPRGSQARLAGKCMRPLPVRVCANTEYVFCAELPGVLGVRSPPTLIPKAGPALCGAGPPAPPKPPPPPCRVCLSVQCTLAVGVEPSHCSHLAGPGYGSQPGGELPFAKLDNRPGSPSEDWRGGSTCCGWRRARPALPGSGKGRPGCSRSWRVAEPGGGRVGRGLYCPLAASGSRPARLQSLRLPGQLLPL